MSLITVENITTIKKGSLVKYKFLYQNEFFFGIFLKHTEDYNFSYIIELLSENNTIDYVPLNQLILQTY